MRLLAPLLAIGLILRLVALGDVPPGFTPDEAAFGYNAYSLLLTGRDEWARPFFTLPVTNLKSFGDDKLPLYAFLTVPPVALFGLTETATRLPNALIGSLAPLMLFLLARTLFPRPKSLAVISAALFALSPWAIQLSRGAFEANLVATILPLSLVLLLRRRYVLAAIIAAIGMYSYHTARLLTVPITLFTWFIFRLPRPAKFFLLLGVLILPTVIGQLTSQNRRMADVSLFHPTDNWAAVADRRFEAQIAGLPVQLARVFSNKPSGVLSQFTHNYLAYFSPQFLLLQGPNESTYGMISGRGVIYYLDALFLLAWLIYFVRHPSKAMLWLGGLLLLSPLTAALTKGPGLAANRAALMLPFLLLACSQGAAWLLLHLKKYRMAILTVLSFVYLFFVTAFLEDYLYHGYKSIARSMLFGYREAFSRAQVITPEYDQVLVSRSLSEPHIYLAFYTKIDPRLYQHSAGNWPDFQALGFSFLDQLDGYSIGKYTFGSVNLDRLSPGILIIARPSELPSAYPNYFTVNYPDGTGAVTVAPRL